MKCIYIHIRDLRLHDNTTLNEVKKIYSDNEIYRVFFLNKEQINSKYASKNAVQFFKNALKDISVNIINVDNLNDIIKQLELLYNKYKYSCIAFHYDYTPYAIKREEIIMSFANKKDIKIINTHDQLLLKNFHLKKNNETYFKFTPYYNSYPKSSIEIVKFDIPIIKKLNISTYDKTRNIMSIKTTELSVYLKFGIISPREAYYYFKENSELAKQLIWRDFYYTYYFYNKSYLGDNGIQINWENNKELFNKWKTGTTGIPIVDAGIRQLNTTGYMHNRVRMIVASTLSKLMLIDWRLGEKYFSNKLRDIDRIQNMAGWHSVVGIAKHSLPYFRVFNPWIQAKKYDPECKYIKMYVSELQDIDCKIILNWETMHNYKNIKYPKPCINYQKQKEKFLKSINK